MKKTWFVVYIACFWSALAGAEPVGGPVLGDAPYMEGPEVGDIAQIVAMQEAEGELSSNEERLDWSQDRLEAWSSRDDEEELANNIPGGGGFAVSGYGVR